MKSIYITRLISDDEASVSLLRLDVLGNRIKTIGAVLEDEPRELKVPKETRIPAGIYPVRLRTVGRLHNNYSARFPQMHRGMLEICDVPGFTAICFHIGNYEYETDGCPLVGYGASFELGNLHVTSSARCYVQFYTEVLGAAEVGSLQVVITDED